MPTRPRCQRIRYARGLVAILRTLLGFERMAALTAKPAAAIADAAQAWGQEDDITVLTVRSVAA